MIKKIQKSSIDPLMTERFISEAIKPVVATCDTRRMAAGEPGLPSVFHWRGQAVKIVEVLKSWKTTGPCRHGSGEMYVRRHFYEVKTDSGAVMKIYFDRQPRGGSKKMGWWLLSVKELQGER